MCVPLSGIKHLLIVYLYLQQPRKSKKTVIVLGSSETTSLIKYTHMFQNKTILFFFFFFCRIAGLTRFEFPDQGLNPSHGSKSTES